MNAKKNKPFQITLTVVQTLALYNDVRDYANSEWNGDLSREEYLAQAKDRLGFPITTYHLKKVCKEIPSVRFNFGEKANPIVQLYARIQKLEDLVASLTADYNKRLIALERAINE